MAPGRGRITVMRRGPRSVVTRALAVSPLRLLTPRNHGRAAWIYAATYGGGLVGGDCVRLDLEVAEGAAALLSTQASTKVYRSPRGAASTLDAAVGPGALLALLPDPVVCFADSSYRQEQRVRLNEGASLLLVDWLTAGRRASGERWRFDRYSNRIEVHDRGRLALLDVSDLDDNDAGLAERLGRFDVLAAIVLMGPALAAAAARLLADLGAQPVTPRAPLLAGASPVAGGGCIIRLAGTTLEEVSSTVRDYLAFVPALLGDNPWLRKY